MRSRSEIVRPISGMTNQEAKRSLLLQYQRLAAFQQEIMAYDIDRLSDKSVNELFNDIEAMQQNIGLTFDRIQATGG